MADKRFCGICARPGHTSAEHQAELRRVEPVVPITLVTDFKAPVTDFKVTKPKHGGKRLGAGRPKTGSAMTHAERQRAYRERRLT